MFQMLVAETIKHKMLDVDFLAICALGRLSATWLAIAPEGLRPALVMVIERRRTRRERDR